LILQPEQETSLAIARNEESFRPRAATCSKRFAYLLPPQTPIFGKSALLGKLSSRTKVEPLAERGAT